MANAPDWQEIQRSSNTTYFPMLFRLLFLDGDRPWPMGLSFAAVLARFVGGGELGGCGRARFLSSDNKTAVGALQILFETSDGFNKSSSAAYHSKKPSSLSISCSCLRCCDIAVREVQAVSLAMLQGSLQHRKKIGMVEKYNSGWL